MGAHRVKGVPSVAVLDHPNKFEKASAALIERQAEMKKLEDEWFELEEKALR